MTTPNVVDVSKHQPTTIDFTDLAANGIKAVIVRIGHGTTQDEHATSHIERAKAAGLFVHAYHFYEGVDGEVAWSIKNAQSLGITAGSYYFLDMEGDISGSWSDILRGFYRNWLMAGFKAGLYCSLSKYDLFNDKELKTNGVYRWIADWDVDEAPGDADIWQYNCSTGLGQYQDKLDKDVDLTGKLIQAVVSPSHETDPNATYQVKAGAFVNFDYSTTSVAGGKMLVASPNGVDKIPKLGPDGDFIFNDHDYDHIWEGIKDRINLPSVGGDIDWTKAIKDHDIALKSDIPDLSGYALKKDIPSVAGFLKLSDLSGYAKLSDIPSLDEYAKKTELPDMTAYYTKSEADQKLADKADKSQLPDLSDYAKRSDIPAEVDLSGYAKKSDIPNLTGYAKLTDIPSLTGYLKQADLVGYAKKSDIPSLADYVTSEELSGYAKKTDLPAPVDTSGFATTSDLSDVRTTAEIASSTASSAQTTAQEAQSTASNASNTASSAYSLASSANSKASQLETKVNQTGKIDSSGQYTNKTPSQYADGVFYEIKNPDYIGIYRSDLDSSAQSGSTAIVTTKKYGQMARQTAEVLDNQRPVTFIRNGYSSSWSSWEVVTTW